MTVQPRSCRVCNCTEDKACIGSCAWVTTDALKAICSACWTRAATQPALLSGTHPWCCDNPSPISWSEKKGWLIVANNMRVMFCPFCGKRLPDAVEFKKLYRTIVKMEKKR